MPKGGTKSNYWKKRCNEYTRQSYHKLAWKEMNSLSQQLPIIVKRLFKDNEMKPQYLLTIHSVCQSASCSWRRKVRSTDSPARVHRLLCQRLAAASNTREAMYAVNEFTVTCRRHIR